MLKQRNTRKQSDVGLGSAIRFYTSRGYTVSIPLTDNQAYDLVVEKEDGLKRIQIKTTRYKRDNIYHVSLTTKGGNKSSSNIKQFKAEEVDFVYILTEDGHEYEIPASEVKQSIALGPSKDIYLVGDFEKFKEVFVKMQEQFQPLQEQVKQISQQLGK